jgi:hypothetical protein
MTTYTKKEEFNNFRKLLAETMAIYLHGNCCLFATALHRGLGWQIVGLFDKNGKLYHAGAMSPDGAIWDVRGEVSEQKFAALFKMELPYSIRKVSEEDISLKKEEKEIEEIKIGITLKQAMRLFPDLPWKQETFEAKVFSFLKEVEALSRKYDIWIFGSFPTKLPLLAEGCGGEKGYELGVTLNGVYKFNRVI